MGFRTAILGCGPRATAHARAYQTISRGEIVACCDQDSARLEAFGEAHGIGGRYADLDAMLAAEKPDLVHMVTPPTLRVGLLEHLAGAGVPAVLVEKPVCVGADDYHALRQLAAKSPTRIAVNHQLRHHPRILEFLEDVQAGRIGEVRFMDASAVLPMSGQGVHVLDLMCAFSGYAPIETVFAACSGYDDINGHHPSPRTTEALITIEGGIRAGLQSGESAPMFDTGKPSHMHKRIAIYGSHGFRHWWMSGWERNAGDGTIESGQHVYVEEDDAGQANLTNAVFDWLDDESTPCPTNLNTSLDEWLVLLAIYQSCVTAGPVDMPFTPPNDLLQQFKAAVGATEKE